MQQLTAIASSIITFINTVAVPLVFAVAFIVFLFGVFRYFIVGGANAEKRKEGTQLIVYALIGFAVMIVVWGLVNLIVGTLGFTNNTRPPLPTFSNTSTDNTTTRSPATTQTTPTTQTSHTPTPGGSFVGPRP